MITGIVNADCEAVLSLIVRGPTGQQRDVEAVVDTGFDGSLSLPSKLIAALGLPWRRRGRAILADGSETLFDIYEATVLWDGEPRRIPVDEAETAALLGTELLKGYELTVQFRPRGIVNIQRLASS